MVAAIGDPLEREATRSAGDAMQPGPAELAAASMPPIGLMREAAGRPRARPAYQSDPAVKSPRLARKVMASSGQPLDEATRSYFEPRFGFDLANVRVHTDDQAARSATLLAARAYSFASDIVYGPGERPGANPLTAHELAHVVQNATSTEMSVIRRQPVGGSSAYEVISPVWRVAQRDIVVVRVVGDGRIFLFYRRSGLGSKGVGSAPAPGSWAPFDAITTQEKAARVPATGSTETLGGVESPYFEKNRYYYNYDSPELRGYGTQTNKDIADWLNAEHIEAGEASNWRAVQAKLERYKPLAPAKPPARTVSGDIGGPPREPPRRSAGAPREPGPSGVAPGGDVETAGARLEGSAGKAGIGAKIGSLLEAALPGPQDVLFLWVGFFGSIAEAQEKLRNDSYKLGFGEAMAANLLGFDASWVNNHLIARPSGEGREGFRGARAGGNNEGVVAGYRFVGRLTYRQRGAFLRQGFAAVMAKLGPGGLNPDNFGFDDVIALGVALLPTVEQLLEIAQEQERERKHQQEIETDYYSRYDPGF